jgi:crotonobetainyl-CoA:carnitine CoA-transferase CaiB-like acyl-CoA transferase
VAGPLDDVRIIDLSQVASGPYATAQLADQGADVIKVEPPNIGDSTRAIPVHSKGGLNAFLATLNRGKRSLIINLDNERGSNCSDR